ncbi:MAG: 50S ribosomal protein L18 [Pirellulaceae bacterium]
MKIRKIVNGQRLRRKYRVRNKIRGTADRPRLTVHRTLTGFSAQLIDDLSGKTLVSGSTREKDLRGSIGYGGNCAAAAKLGKVVAERAKAAGIERVAFDRGHCRYHGRVAAFADAAREAGLDF